MALSDIRKRNYDAGPMWGYTCYQFNLPGNPLKTTEIRAVLGNPGNMRWLTCTHQRITLEVSWVPTATPENQIDLVSVHCALSNAGGPRRKGLQNQTPANDLMLQQCTFTPLYEVLCLFSEGGGPQAP